MMFTLVSYDIPENKRRNKIANILKDYGVRVQYSVFECILNKDILKEMIERLLAIIKEEEDSIRIYYLCEECYKKVDVYGLGNLTQDEDVYII